MRGGPTGDRRVVHRRDGRRPAHRYPGLERRRARRGRGVRERSEDRRARGAGGPLEEHGAVSAEVAAAMAAGVRERLGAEVGVAVTGVAGPAAEPREARRARPLPRLGAGAEKGASSRCPATATRSEHARRSPRSISRARS